MNFLKFYQFVFTLFLVGFFSAQKSYDVLNHEGNQLYEKKNYERASEKFQQAAKVNDKDFTAHYNLGNSYYKRKMYEEAKLEYEKANQVSATLADKAAVLHNLGNAYMETDNPEKAAEYYKQSLKQDPYNENTRKNYEIAKLKEKENQQDQNQGNSGGGGEQDQNQGKDKGNTPQNQNGTGQQNKGDGEGEDDNPNQNNQNQSGMPKNLQDAIMNRVENKERETAKRILNKDSYSMPESNEKDW